MERQSKRVNATPFLACLAASLCLYLWGNEVERKWLDWGEVATECKRPSWKEKKMEVRGLGHVTGKGVGFGSERGAQE